MKCKGENRCWFLEQNIAIEMDEFNKKLEKVNKKKTGAL